MLKAIFGFSSDTDFYNPVGKPVHDLLSTKEKIKGRVLPLLGQVSLFALSVGMSAMGASLEEAALSVGILGGLAAYMRHSQLSNYKKKLDNENLYDLSTPQDAARFHEKYPEHKGLPAQLCLIAAEAGLDKPPLLHVGENTDYAAILDLDFGKKKNLLIEINPKILKEESPALVAHLLAHEMGHGRLGHTNSLPAVVSGTAIGAHISAGVQMAVSGNYLGGIFYTVAALTAHKMAGAKSQQYKERECDRHALLVSGVGREAADFFEKGTTQLEKGAPLPLRIAFGAIDTYQSLMAAHPSHEKRTQYFRDFTDANHAYLEKTRIKNGLVPSKPHRFKMV